jgi:hypothetical protein
LARWTTTTLLTLVLLAALPAVAAAEPGRESERLAAETEILRLLNEERAAHGLSTLRLSNQQHRKAREHSQTMRTQDRLHHPDRLTAEIYPSNAWAGMAENAARARSAQGAHDAFMASAPHRANLLGDWTHASVGVAFDGNRWWVTQRFVRVKPGHTLPMFRDMPSSDWQRTAVVRGWRNGILNGCGPDLVCAGQTINRAQMASLITRAAGLGESDSADRYEDVHPDDVHHGAIGALVDNGVTLGCALGRYCPADDVTRAEMGSFVTRAKTWLPDLSDRFDDVQAGSTHGPSINRIAERGVTDGCADRRYCPTRSITRAEMAAMLVRAF